MWSVYGVRVVLRIGDPMEKWGWVERVGRTFSSLTRFLGTLESHSGLSAGVTDTQKQREKIGRACVTDRSGCWRQGFVFSDLGRSAGWKRGRSHSKAWSRRPSGCGAQAASLRATDGGKGRSQGTRCIGWTGLQWRLSQLHAGLHLLPQFCPVPASQIKPRKRHVGAFSMLRTQIRQLP